MACFVVPAAMGVLIHIIRKKLPSSLHVEWLATMIFGGTVGLAVEHISHGEIVPWPPFFTAMSSPNDMAAMINEMALVGIPMSIALVMAWAVIVLFYNKFYAQYLSKTKSPALSSNPLR